MTLTMATSTFNAKLHKTATPKVHTISLGTDRVTDVCPPPMLGEISDATSPHHLFLASIGACVNLVFEIALSKARIEVFDLHSDITGDYETDDETGVACFTTIQIDTSVTLPEGVKAEKVKRLFDVAHKNCPIGNCLVGSCVKLVTNLDITYQ